MVRVDIIKKIHPKIYIIHYCPMKLWVDLREYNYKYILSLVHILSYCALTDTRTAMASAHAVMAIVCTDMAKLGWDNDNSHGL